LDRVLGASLLPPDFQRPAISQMQFRFAALGGAGHRSPDIGKLHVDRLDCRTERTGRKPEMLFDQRSQRRRQVMPGYV
jgi:hypothetical protein